MVKRCIIKIFVLCSFITLFAQNYDTENYSYSQLDNYYRAQSWALVIEKGEEFLEKYPFTIYESEVTFFLAESFYHLDVFSFSQELFEDLLLEENLEKELKRKSMYRLGLILSMQGEHEQALVYLHSLASNPFNDEKDKNVLLYSARSLSSLRRTEELTVVIKHYIKQYGNNSIPVEVEPLLGSLWLGMGIEAFDGKRYVEALEYFKRADLQKVEGEKSPEHYEQSGLYQAVIYYIEGDVDASLRILEDRMHDDGSTAFEYTSLIAIIYGEKENKEKSEQYAKKALEIFQKLPQQYDFGVRFYLHQAIVLQYAQILYERKDFSSVDSLIDTFEASYIDFPYYSLSEDLSLLKAQSLYKNGNTEKALSLFRQYFPKSTETVKALFLSDFWLEGSDIALETDDAYLKGLAFYYLRDWNGAYEAFSVVLENKNHTEYQWAQYYAALSQYFNGSYMSALNLLGNFLLSQPYHEKVWDANMVSAICALEEGQIEKALEYSLDAVYTSKTNEQRQTASVFAAGLYIDEKNYREANALLLEFSTSNDERSISPRLLLAQTYSQMGNIAQADNELKKIISRFPNNDLAREAAYKRGELYFESGDYSQAEKVFREFRYNYADGIYTDVSLFFEAESRLKQDDYNGAILLYTDLINRYLTSTYRFASINALVNLHKNLEEYNTAFEYANQAKREYPTDFNASSLVSQLEELSALASGTDSEIAQARINWDNAGGNTTANGRQKGYELSVLYSKNSNDSDKALEILEDIQMRFQNINGEYSLKANVYNLLGDIEREKNNCQVAARYFLQQAEVLALMGDAQGGIAKALYSAIEAFDCAGLNADAAAVFKEMEKSYEDSIWYERASIIVLEKRN